MFDRCVPSVRKSSISVALTLWSWSMYQPLTWSAMKFLLHLLILTLWFLLILFPIPSGAKCQYLLGRMADQIRVVLGHKALNLYEVHWAFSVKVFEVIFSDVRSFEPKWMMRQSGCCWSFVISVSVFSNSSNTSPQISFHRIIQMVKSEKLWQDYLLVNMRVYVVRDNAGCFKCILGLSWRTCAKMGANLL